MEPQFSASLLHDNPDPFKQVWVLIGPGPEGQKNFRLGYYYGHDVCREYNPEIPDTTPQQRCEFRRDCNNGATDAIGGGPP
jgi:hypothetical protein